MCAAVLGIHGIGQHKKTAATLEEGWRSAMQRSVELINERQPLPSLDVAFYGNLFSRPDGRLGSTSEETSPLSVNEELFVEDVLSSGILADVDADEIAARELGLPAIPSKVARLLVRVDRKFGRNTGKYLLFILRQVYRYLTDKDLSKAIRSVVAGAIQSNTKIILAHSLGSVIAYDMAARGELFPRVPEQGEHRCIVTFGSPLSWPTVLRMLGHGSQILDIQGTWHNLYDSTDAVTGGQGLKVSAVQNQRVRNGLRDPHAAVMYLRQPAMGALLTSHTGI